eukprot:2193818-Rhodomonas_salina.1
MCIRDSPPSSLSLLLLSGLDVGHGSRRCPRLALIYEGDAAVYGGNVAIHGGKTAIHGGNAAVYGGNAAVYGGNAA